MTVQPSLPAKQMLDLVNALIAVVSEENAALSRGTPAALASTVGRKVSLGRELENHVALLRQGALLDQGDDPDLGDRLAGRGEQLKAVMAENSDRLRHSMVSTRRRIDAIMRALREQEARPGPYGATGRRSPVVLPAKPGRQA